MQAVIISSLVEFKSYKLCKAVVQKALKFKEITVKLNKAKQL